MRFVKTIWKWFVLPHRCVSPGGTVLWITWFGLGKLHRDDGPAIEYPDGTREWYQNGQLHREDGPAYEGADGHREWHRNDLLHRDDGPAIECPDGTREWYRDGHLWFLEYPPHTLH